MPVKVVDASAVGALLFGEPEAVHVAGRVQGHRLVAPALLPFEVTNICVKKLKRYPAQHAVLLDALRLLGRFAIDLFEMDVHGVAKLAMEKKLTAYDASYLLLANELGAELVTLDHELKIATES